MGTELFIFQSTKEFKPMISRKSLNNLLFISLFLVYFRFLPLNVETQPILSFIISISILITNYRDYFSREIKLFLDEIFLLFIIVILFIYTLLQFLFWHEIVVLDCIKYLIGIVFYLSIRRRFIVSRKIVFLVVCSLTIVGIFNLLLPDIYSLIFGPIIPRTLDSVRDGIRGINILTPEPSYFASFELIILNLIEFELDKDNDVVHTKYLKWCKWAIIMLAFLTKSALTIGIAIVFLIPPKKYINFRKLYKFGILIVFVFLFAGFTILKENRLFQIFDLMYYVIKEGDVDYQKLLFEQESSGGTRIVVNFLAFSSLFIKPLGSGLGSFPHVYNDLAKHLNLDLSTHEVLGNANYSSIYAQTYFANLCNDIGIFSLLLMCVVFLGISKYNSVNVRRKRFFSLLVLLLFQSQITSPAFWFVLYLSKINRNVV